MGKEALAGMATKELILYARYLAMPPEERTFVYIPRWATAGLKKALEDAEDDKMIRVGDKYVGGIVRAFSEADDCKMVVVPYRSHSHTVAP